MEVTIEKKVVLKEGKTFCISPSQAMLGITEGVVKVVSIEDFESVKSKYADPVPLVELVPEYQEESWVVYEYTDGEEKGEKFSLNASLFVDHTSEW